MVCFWILGSLNNPEWMHNDFHRNNKQKERFNINNNNNNHY